MLLLYISEWRCEQPRKKAEGNLRPVTRHISYATRLPLQDAMTRLLQHRQAHKDAYPDVAIEYRLLVVSTLSDDTKDRTLSMMGVKLVENLPMTLEDFTSAANAV